jgi:uncharacterized protein (DUF2141 family)
MASHPTPYVSLKPAKISVRHEETRHEDTQRGAPGGNPAGTARAGASAIGKADRECAWPRAPSGKVEVSLFNTPETFLKQPLRQRSLTADGKEELVFEFSGLLDGHYAVVVVHDENDNGRLDNGFLGFGGESFGYSNDPFTWWGRPSFEAASFPVGTENLAIDIDLD